MSSMTKQAMIEVFTKAGFDEQAMHKFHASFEKLYPKGHQEFCEFLGIGQDEIAKIRQMS